MAAKKSYPEEENLGKDCLFWQRVDLSSKRGLGAQALGCFYPKIELEGRLSCEGIIDDVCLFIKDGRKPSSLTQDQIMEIRLRDPLSDNRELPPGNTY